MSKETLAALDAAMRDHIIDEAETTDPGAFVTAWVAVAALTPQVNGDTTYWHVTPDGQPPHIDVGLLRLDTEHALNDHDGDDDA